jgi:signal transduction histidine kinase
MRPAAEPSAHVVFPISVDPETNPEPTATYALRHDWLLAAFEHARDLLTQIDYGPAISAAIAKVQLLLDAENASICVLEPGAATVQHMAAEDGSITEAEAVAGASNPPYEPLPEAVVIHRCRTCPACRLLPHAEWCASAPLYVDKQQIGMLCAMRRRSRPPFRQDQLRLLQLLAGWTAVAIANARKVRAVQEQQRSERERIAAHLHDNAAQSLSVISLKMDQVETILGSSLPDAALQQLHAVKDLSQQLMAQVRTAFGELREGQPQPDDLITALVRCIDSFMQTAGLPVEFNISGSFALPSETHTQVVQIVREALNNVGRHAHASRVEVQLIADTQSVRVIVRDNGAGFDLSAAGEEQPHLGMILMRERAQRSGGSLTINSNPGHGTQVTLAYPASRQP